MAGSEVICDLVQTHHTYSANPEKGLSSEHCQLPAEALTPSAVLFLSTWVAPGQVCRMVSMQGVVKVRDHWLRKEGSDREVEVPQSKLVEHLRQILADSGSQDALLTKPTPGT